MKKQILVLFISILAANTLVAQSNYDKRVEGNVNAYIEKIEANTTLTKEEKVKLFELKKVHTIGFWKVNEDFKDAPELQEERVKVGKAYAVTVIEAFGNKRGSEILKAARGKKE